MARRVGIAVAQVLGGDSDGDAAPERARSATALGARLRPTRPSQSLERVLRPGPRRGRPAATTSAHGSTVPLDYERPGGRTIELAVLRVPALGERRSGSLVVNPGGPGAPGTTYAAAAGRVFRAPLLDHFDVVGFDPRGTGASSPGRLPVRRGARPLPRRRPRARRRDRAARRSSTPRAAGRGLRRRRTPRLAAHVTTIEAARDMDVLRAALGRRSSTTSVRPTAPSSARRTPSCSRDQVGRFVLDGAVDVSLSSRDLSLEQAARLRDRAACLRRELRRDRRLLLPRRLRRRGAGTGSPTSSTRSTPSRCRPPRARELAVGNAFYGIVAPLYNRDYWFVAERGPAAPASTVTGPLLLQPGRPLRLPRRPTATPTTAARRSPRSTASTTRAPLPPGKVPAPDPRLRGGLAHLRRRLRLGPARLLGQVATSTEEPLDDRRRRGAADRRHRHDPRPGHAVRLGRGAGRPARVRASWSAATATATPATTPATSASTGRRGLPGSTARVPDDGLSC